MTQIESKCGSMKNKPILPPIYLLVSILIMIALHFIFPVLKMISFPWNCLGLIPLLLGLVINIITDKTFKKHNTTIKPFQESTALITDGVFSLSRNPMYLGFGFDLLGIVVLMGSLSPYIVVLAFMVLMDIVFVRTEERMLENTFGAGWVEYKKKVRRWI
jgi:protein-S-isoprenylcysteine O-methyltransferase Ste14